MPLPHSARVAVYKRKLNLSCGEKRKKKINCHNESCGSSAPMMSSKKHLTRYSLCLILYIIICLTLLFVKINNSLVAKYVTFDAASSNNSVTQYPVEIVPLDVSIDPEIIEVSLQRISTICEKYNRTTSLERNHFFYSPKNNALFCWIRKVASTSFTKLFADLRGIQMRQNYYKESKVLSPDTVEEFLNLIDDMGVFKFLAVRHPFERLVSSYRSRIEDNTRYSAQAWIFVPRIFYLTRPELFQFNETIGNPLQRIFDDNRRLKLVPTFGEFVLWLLKQPEDNDDEHWSQYHSHCSICQMNFDFVLKIDHQFIHELNYVLSQLSLKSNQRSLSKLGQTRGGLTNFQRTCEYLSTLSPNTAIKLYERYRIDFDMFDYKLSTYSSCIKL